MVGVAVNVTFVPAQMVVAVDEVETDGTRVELTVMVIPVLVAVVGEAQLALEVITQVTTSLLAKVVLLNVVELVPTFVAPTFH